MNPYILVFLLLTGLFLLLAPRKWAPLPLLMGVSYVTVAQGIDVGPFTFTVIRMLVIAGFIRVVTRGERILGGLIGLDYLMIAWGGWALLSSAFHDEPKDALVFRLGITYNYLGIYFLYRVFCQSFDDVKRVLEFVAIILVPVAVEMIYEHLKVHNLFSVLGGVASSPAVREGRIRAQGPFAHSILAGTVGAVCLPFSIFLWRSNQKRSIIGTCASLVIVIASASSGPIMSAAAALGALLLWRFRDQIKYLRWAVIMSYIGLEIIMTRPAYFILARIDLAGGSTGWHRAQLIQSAFAHLSEWWVAGTDHTRHWMPSGVSWSVEHTDITNYYLKMGVWGGLPLMILFIAILGRAFTMVGGSHRGTDGVSSQDGFLFWVLGSALFAHAVTSIGVSYFDQSFVFIYMTLALIGSAWAAGRQHLSNFEIATADTVIVRPVIAEHGA